MDLLVDDYKAMSNGRFLGVLRWPQFDILWQALSENGDDWYVYEPDKDETPTAPLSRRQMIEFLATSDVYLRKLCTKDRCGAVYTDSLERPSFVKIYNPRLMGGCGMGKAPLPQWLISRVKPVSLID